MKSITVFTMFAVLSFGLAAPSNTSDELEKRDSKDWQATFYALADCKGVSYGTGVKTGSTTCKKDVFPAAHPVRGPYGRSYVFKAPPGKKCEAHFYWDDICSDPAEFVFVDENLECHNAPGGKVSSLKIICKD